MTFRTLVKRSTTELRELIMESEVIKFAYDTETVSCYWIEIEINTSEDKTFKLAIHRCYKNLYLKRANYNTYSV